MTEHTAAPTRPSLPPELRSEEVLTAIASLRAAVIDDNTLAEWFRPGYLLEVAKLLAALDATLLPYVQDAERWRAFRLLGKSAEAMDDIADAAAADAALDAHLSALHAERERLRERVEQLEIGAQHALSTRYADEGAHGRALAALQETLVARATTPAETPAHER